MTWKPIDAPANFNDVLAPGIPPWMVRPLNDWYSQHGLGDLAAAFDAAARNASLLSTYSTYSFASLLTRMSEETVISYLDFIVYATSAFTENLKNFFDPTAADDLDKILRLCGSEWRVGVRDGQRGLERRVPSGVQLAADTVIAQHASAGDLLADAWHAAFGRTPNLEEAYSRAIKAVEAAAIPVVEPKNSKATLGTTIRTMRDQRGWSLLLADVETQPFPDMILEMMVTLWQGHSSRHGANGYRKPTNSEAEAAVMLAVPLVHWFSTGAAKLRK